MRILRPKKPGNSVLPEDLIDPNIDFWIEPLGAALEAFGFDLPIVGATTVFTKMEIDRTPGAALIANLQPVLGKLTGNMQNLPQAGSGSHAIRVAWEPLKDRRQRQAVVSKSVNPVITNLCQHFNIRRPRTRTIDQTQKPLLLQLEARNTLASVTRQGNT